MKGEEEKKKFRILLKSRVSQPSTFQKPDFLERYWTMKTENDPTRKNHSRMATLLIDKKTVNRLGSQLVESHANKPSAYAMKLMQKMGWKEGQGLGKEENGIAKHITIAKREENLGLGHDSSASAEQAKDHWWNNEFSQNLASFASAIARSTEKKKKKSSKKSKKGKDSSSEESSSSDSDSDSDSDKEIIKRPVSNGAEPTLEELFILTGGKRFGMRARMEQKGKHRRTEGDAGVVIRTEIETTTAATVSVESSSPTREKKEKKEKKQKKEKKSKKDREDKTAEVEGEPIVYEEEITKKEKKSKKAKKRKASELDD